MATTKTPAKTTTTPAKDKSGLRGPQVRILGALKKAGKPMTRSQIAEKAPVDVAACVEYIGSHDDAKRKANDAKHFPSLVTLKLVKFGPPEEDGGQTYEITAAGKQAFDKADK